MRMAAGTAEIVLTTGKAKTMIWRWQDRFQEAGIAGQDATLARLMR